MKTTHTSYGQRQRLLLVAKNSLFLRILPHFVLAWSKTGDREE